MAPRAREHSGRDSRARAERAKVSTASAPSGQLWRGEGRQTFPECNIHKFFPLSKIIRVPPSGTVSRGGPGSGAAMAEAEKLYVFCNKEMQIKGTLRDEESV